MFQKELSMRKYTLIVLASSCLASGTGNYLNAQTKQIEKNHKETSKVSKDNQKPTEVSNISDAEKIFFVLNKVQFVHGKSLTEEEKNQPFKNYIGKRISVSKFRSLVNELNAIYLSKGLILSHAYIPPQKARNGIIKIILVEGSINKLYIKGKLAPEIRAKIETIMRPVLKQNPLRNRELEHAKLLINDLPGISARSIISPNKDEKLKANITILVEQKDFQFGLHSDNYLNRLDGAMRLGANFIRHNFIPGTSFAVSVGQAINPNRSNYFKTYAKYFLGDMGDSILFSYLHLKNRPNYSAIGFRVSPNEIGITKLWHIDISHPVILNRQYKQKVEFGISRNNTILSDNSGLKFSDTVASIDLSSSMNFIALLDGQNSLTLTWSRGLGHALGAQDDKSSRPNAKLNYTKVNVDYQYQKDITPQLHLSFHTIGQLGFSPLLASQEFSAGGQACGIGYDPGELIGDSGVCAHTQMNYILPKAKDLGLNYWYGFSFYDHAYIKNQPDGQNTILTDNADSFGVGLYMSISKKFSWQALYALPLNHVVALEKQADNSKAYKGRVFFMAHYSE